VAQTDGEVVVTQGRREQLVQELRTAERARDLLTELERRLKEENRPELEQQLTQLDRLAESLPEGHNVRLLVESAAGSARTRGARRAGSAASRSRSVVEGRISTLRGTISRQDALSRLDT
jgi:fructose-1,6-bisphosphatase/inositol monophosphatase family enzyme